LQPKARGLTWDPPSFLVPLTAQGRLAKSQLNGSQSGKANGARTCRAIEKVFREAKPSRPAKPTKVRPFPLQRPCRGHASDEAKTNQMGFAKCPFDHKEFEVKDGRKAALSTNAFGTVYGVASGKPMPVCDYAGFAPFGFGYRRCAGEQLTIQVFEDFLRKVWKDKIEFVQPADWSHDGDRRQCRLFAINLRPRKSRGSH
jgi:hypothetical protein